MRAAAAVALDRQQINAWLADDTLFKVWSIDRTGWIDPFTGSVIKCGQDGLKAAKRHLLKNRPWMKFGLRSLPELLIIRWAHHLERNIESDGRLRVFHNNGSWLNPYTGTWEDRVPLENGHVTHATVQAMARVLARIPSIDGMEPLATSEISRRLHQPRTPSGRMTVAQPAHQRSGERSGDHGGSTTELLAAASAVRAPSGRNPDLLKARAVLEKMLPQIPVIPGWDIGLCYQPHSVIGGDFYDLVRIDDHHLFIAMGDVSGHGTSAALVVASTLKSLRHAVRAGGNLSDIMVRFNDDIQEDLLKSYFITMFAGLINLDSKIMTCVCAGHHPALLGNAKRRSILTSLGTPAPAIGLMTGDVFVSHLEPMTVQLKPGDTLLQFTDGLFEASNTERQTYGRRQVMANFLMEMDKHPKETVANMVDSVRRFTGDHFNDDVTAMAIKLHDR